MVHFQTSRTRPESVISALEWAWLPVITTTMVLRISTSHVLDRIIYSGTTGTEPSQMSLRRRVFQIHVGQLARRLWITTTTESLTSLCQTMSTSLSIICRSLVWDALVNSRELRCSADQ